MQIETCLDREELTIDEEFENEYNEIVKDLDLNHLLIGQEAEHRSIAISPMNKTERAVYKELCASEVSLDSYDAVIPLRVLQALKAVKGFLEGIAKEKNEKVKYQVWIDEDPDPVLVAEIGWRRYYLIGRWGEELQTFQDLQKRAIARIKSKMAKKISEARMVVEEWDRDPDNVALMKLNDDINSIHF